MFVLCCSVNYRKQQSLMQMHVMHVNMKSSIHFCNWVNVFKTFKLKFCYLQSQNVLCICPM